MALSTVAASVAAAVLDTMSLDARYLISHDVTSGALSAVSSAVQTFLTQRLKEDRLAVYHDLEAHAKSSYGDTRPFLIFEGRTWTYKDFYSDVQRVGNWLMKDLQITRGEIVAVNGTNSPEHMMIWYALEGIGAVPSFINCNLTGQSLMHCVKICESRYMLVDEEVRKLVETAEDKLSKGGCRTLYYGTGLASALKDATEIPRSRNSNFKPNELSSLLYTSGTTGMPRDTIDKGKRDSYVKKCDVVSVDELGNHAKFWPEVRESKADIPQYVGELCRYLVNAPPSPLDKKHNVRMAWGNGMRPDVWEVFRQRFGIEEINELYAATDGMRGTVNRNRGDFGKFAVAKRGAIWNYVNGADEKRIKIDTVTQEIIRDKDGFAIECRAGEPGEVVYRIVPTPVTLGFTGYYNDEEAGEKRKVRNLFIEGDHWFRSGDLMRQYADGCVYFVDRLGDTFRWKSENVSTNEVGDVIGSFDQIAEANVYGVQVPNADGRCGCAAIVLVDGLDEQKLDLERLAKHSISTLPRYAVPVFVRVVKALQYTGTMKVQKGALREEGIDPDKVSANASTKDSMYWLPPGQSVYVPFRRRDWDGLQGGRVRL